MTESDLKKTLLNLQEQAYHFSDEEALALLPAMLEYIGSTDAELRDELIYSTFVNWIYTQHLFSAKKMRTILHIVLDEQHMFYRMGEKERDGVFIRAFSVLLLPLLLGAHRDQPYLSMQEIGEVKEKLICFLQQEQDKRGFVEEKGWAHAIAHAADALDELALCTEMGQADLLEMLAVIHGVICDSKQVYTHGEEERLGTVVLSVISRELLEQNQINDWIITFQKPVFAEKELPDLLYIHANVRNFLQSLYFRLQWKAQLAPHITVFDRTLHAINRFSD